MLKKILLPSIILFGLSVNAQISLTASQVAPLNSIITYYDANVPSPPFVFSKSGINNTWDFTGITAWPGQDDTTYIIPPSNGLLSSSFPSATHCMYDDGANANYTYIQVTPSAAYFLGFSGDLLGNGTTVPAVATPPLESYTFPYTYGSSNAGSSYVEIYTTGAAVGQPTFDSVHYKSTLINDRTCIAAGNLIVPSGTYQSLLIRSINQTIDSVWVKGAATGGIWFQAPGFPTMSEDSSFYWYTDQYLIEFAAALYDETGTLHDVTYFKSFSSNTSIPEQVIREEIYPNPATGILHVNLGIFGETNFRIMNLQGAEIAYGKLTGNKINISSMVPGIYLIEFTQNNNQTIVKRFVKE